MPANTLTKPDVTALDKALVNHRRQPLKVTTDDNTGADPLSDVVLEAAKRVYGKQGAAAAQLGKNEGNFSRDVKAERLPIGQLRELGPAFLAELGKGLQEQYGPLSSPEARARQTLDTMQECVNELRQYVDEKAS